MRANWNEVIAAQLLNNKRTWRPPPLTFAKLYRSNL